MRKSVVKKLVISMMIVLVQPMLSPASQAWAKKKKPPRAFSFFVDNGKASQGECDGEREIPRKLKRVKELSKAGSYMGSELIVSELKGKSEEEMWKHFFREKASCNTALAKTPSSIQEDKLKAGKVELPPDEGDDEPDDEPSAGETPDPE